MDAKTIINRLDQGRLAYRGEHEGRVSSWGLTRKGDVRGYEGVATSATRGRPVMLGIDTAPLRDGGTCIRASQCVQVISNVDRSRCQARSLPSYTLQAPGRVSWLPMLPRKEPCVRSWHTSLKAILWGDPCTIFLFSGPLGKRGNSSAGAEARSTMGGHQEPCYLFRSWRLPLRNTPAG